jgi:hypothetical protein
MWIVINSRKNSVLRELDLLLDWDDIVILFYNDFFAIDHSDRTFEPFSTPDYKVTGG